MAVPQGFRPSLSPQQVKDYRRLYEQQPDRFNDQTIQALEQHAEYYKLPFAENQESYLGKTGEVMKQVGAGFFSGFTTFNVNASKKEVDEYRRMVEAYTIDEMNEAVLPLGLRVKVRKNLNYMKLPRFAQKIYDSIKSNCMVVECSDKTLLEIGVYIKTPTAKKVSCVPYKKGRTLDKN